MSILGDGETLSEGTGAGGEGTLAAAPALCRAVGVVWAGVADVGSSSYYLCALLCWVLDAISVQFPERPCLSPGFCPADPVPLPCVQGCLPALWLPCAWL